MTLTEFLLARIAEDEMAAKRAASHVEWVRMCDWVAEKSNPDVGLYLLDHWPARVLAECEARRRIIDLYWTEDGGDYALGRDTMHAEVLELLALPYADHPDYREEWRP